jgi:hypothetical protein
LNVAGLAIVDSVFCSSCSGSGLQHGLRCKILFPVTTFLLIIAGITVYYYAVGFTSFSKEKAVSIHDDILQGLSGLRSVSIAVIIFRIQSLENRSNSVKQHTLNYISQTMGWTYPEWTSALENDIKSKVITNRYYSNQHLRDDVIIVA